MSADNNKLILMSSDEEQIPVGKYIVAGLPRKANMSQTVMSPSALS
jgi:hypothetical protein